MGVQIVFLGSALQTCHKLMKAGLRPISATANMVNHGVETWYASPDFFYQWGGPMMDKGPIILPHSVPAGPVAQRGFFMTKGSKSGDLQ